MSKMHLSPVSNAGLNIPNDTALVLLVDDQPMVGEAIRRLLIGESDIDLHYCPRGLDAINVANRIRPTVILQDLVLPDINGIDLVRNFRDNSGTAITPIVVLSSKEDAQVKSTAFEAGANDYVVKLPDRAELVARLRYHSRAYLGQIQRNEAFHALRESQQRLLESNTSLVSLNQQLNEFVGMAAHDLRNPLGVVLGFAKFLLGKEVTPEQQRKFLSTIQSSSEFMLLLVNDLLDISKIESGRLMLRPVMSSLGALVETNIAFHRILASEKEIEILVSIDPRTPKVSIDPHQIEQVLNNLLINAIKYSHPKTTIEVALAPKDQQVIVLSVRDHGQGIPTEDLDKLFTPFGVTSVKGTKGEKSTGLGLAIAKKVVDAHGGRIWVDSTPGEGTTFFVALPSGGTVD